MRVGEAGKEIEKSDAQQAWLTKCKVNIEHSSVRLLGITDMLSAEV